jgi:uncharacterized protein (TIGR02145 family)
VAFSGTQRRADAPAVIKNLTGKITVNLPAESYRNAEVALYSVNGKAVLRQKTSAATAANSISRQNVAPGAYLLSVTGTDDAAFSSRLTHSGGNLDITVAFGGENRPAARQLAKEAAAGDWNVTVSATATGYADTVFAIRPVKGTNAAQNITLRALPPSTYAVTVTSAGTGATGGGMYAPGETVSINAGMAPSGKAFENWTTTSSGVSFANANNATTTFTMPANAVTVTAVFETIPVTPPVVGGNNCTSAETCKSKVMPDGKTWMTENLNIETASGSYCYKNSADSCAKYGRLYEWEAAKTACPLGWHLPTRQEWGELAKAANGTGDYGAGGTAAKRLKSTVGWNSWSSDSKGTDNYGFTALPGGYRFYGDGSFRNAGDSGDWWTATEDSSGYAYSRCMDYYDDYVSENYDRKGYGFSVRCVGD